MTIKVSLLVEPVDETAQIHLKRWGKDKGVIEDRTFIAPIAPTASQTFEVEEGGKVDVTIESAQKIIHDHEQFVVRVEPRAEEKSENAPARPMPKAKERNVGHD